MPSVAGVQRTAATADSIFYKLGKEAYLFLEPQ